MNGKYLALGSTFIMFLVCGYYLLETSLFIPDWDTVSFAFWGFNGHRTVHQDGTHLLLGYITGLYQTFSSTKTELLHNMRLTAFLFGCMGIIFYSCFVYSLYRERLDLYVFLLGFYIFVPYYRFIISSMDDNFYVYPFLSLFCLSIYKYYDEEKFKWLFAACISIIIALLLGLSYSVFALFLVTPLFKENLNRTRIIHLGAGFAVFLSALFVFLWFHKSFSGLDSYSLISENYLKKFYPNADWSHLKEMLAYSWTEPFTGCQNLDCRFYFRESVNPAKMPDRKVYFFSILAVLGILFFPPFYWIRKKRKNLVFSILSIIIISYFILFLGYTKSFEVQERYDFFSFILPFLLEGLKKERLIRAFKFFLYTGLAVLYAMFFRYQFEIGKLDSPLRLYREAALQGKEFHFSSEDLPSYDRGRHFLAWLYLDHLKIYNIGDKYLRLKELYSFSNPDEFDYSKKCKQADVFISQKMKDYLLKTKKIKCSSD